MASFFSELSLVIVLTFIVSVFVSRLRQPLIIGYLLTGIIVSPLFLDVLVEKDGFLAFSHIGISFLLFLVGLQLDMKLIRDVVLPAILTGLGQIVSTSILTIILTQLMGFELMKSVLFAVGLSFSSTIVIVKLLTDSGDLNTFFGKVSLGFLLVQDFIAALILVFISTHIKTGNLFSIISLIEIIKLASGIILIIFVLQLFLPKILKMIQNHEELLFLFTISWCFGFAGLFDYLGFSLEVGALLSGVLIASYPVHNKISHKIIALRDFFLVIFFMFLGYELMPDIAKSNMDVFSRVSVGITVFSEILPYAIILSVIVLIGNPIIVYLILRKLKHNSKTSLFSGFAVSQISEFSIIIFLLAKQSQLVTQKDVTLITTVALITIVCSTYLYILKEKIYGILNKYIG